MKFDCWLHYKNLEPDQSDYPASQYKPPLQLTWQSPNTQLLPIETGELIFPVARSSAKRTQINFLSEMMYVDHVLWIMLVLEREVLRAVHCECEARHSLKPVSLHSTCYAKYSSLTQYACYFKLHSRSSRLQQNQEKSASAVHVAAQPTIHSPSISEGTIREKDVSPSPHHSCGTCFLPTSDFSTTSINFSGKDSKLTICNSPCICHWGSMLKAWTLLLLLLLLL